jgi:hypothetical protein
MTELSHSPGGSKSSGGSLYNVVELILDRGLVIDVFVRVSLVGIEVLTIDARVVVASVDAYLRFAEACGRIDLTGGSQPVGLPGLVGQLTGGPARTEASAMKEVEAMKRGGN